MLVVQSISYVLRLFLFSTSISTQYHSFLIFLDFVCLYLTKGLLIVQISSKITEFCSGLYLGVTAISMRWVFDFFFVKSMILHGYESRNNSVPVSPVVLGGT